MALRPKYATMSVREISDLYVDGLLNLSPPFQRDSVWTKRDRAMLIESVLLGIPLPAIFLYSLGDEMQVIDGKQRLETIIRFLGVGEYEDEPLEVRVATAKDDHRRSIAFEHLGNQQKRQFLSTRLPVVTVDPDGGIGEVIDLFVRLNSTGKRLTGMERRRAEYFESETLNRAHALAQDLRERFVELGVLTATGISRLAHVELTLELLLSIAQGQPLNKKTSIDQIISGHKIPNADLHSAANRLKRAVADAEDIWIAGTTRSRSLESSRFSHASDFFSLIYFLADRRTNGSVLLKPNAAIAHDLLAGFDVMTLEVANAQRAYLRMPHGSERAVRYLQTVKEGTDSYTHRVARHRILGEILDDTVLTPLDPKRRFSSDQRRLLWLKSNRECERCGCELKLGDAQLDHVVPYILGGKTVRTNARVLCQPCNTSRGAGRW